MSRNSFNPKAVTETSEQLTRNAIAELYIHWATLPHVKETLDELCKDLLAASRAPRGDALNRYVDPADASDGSSTPPAHGRSPSPPGSPPITRLPGVAPRSAAERTSPVGVNRPVMRVDEMDSRSPSAGAASPISASLSTLSEASGLSSISPTPPPEVVTSHHHIPQHHLSGNLRAASSTSSASGAPPVGASRAAGTNEIPNFYFKGVTEGRVEEQNSQELWALRSAFAMPQRGGRAVSAADRGYSFRSPNGETLVVDPTRVYKKEKFEEVSGQIFGLPKWLSDLVFRRILSHCGVEETADSTVNYTQVLRFYEEVMANSTPNKRLFDLIKGDPKRNYCAQDDFRIAVRLLVEHHQGLDFLSQPEFQEFYCRTVAIRIIYELDLRQDRRVTWYQFDRSDLPTVMFELDHTSDINQILRYFSYEHFYVLYCRFWELDSDRDQMLELSDLQQYSNGTITTSVLKRVVQGAGRKLTQNTPGKLDFEDFVYFCLAEEDKNSSAAIFYWFKVLDLDADGVLSGYEIGYFMEEQRPKLAEVGLDEVKTEDMLCQMLDMIGATRVANRPHGLTLADLKSCPTPANFFNMIFNANKFSRFEHRDPFGEHQMRQHLEKTDWDRFARLEYDRMAAEVQQ